VSNRGQDKSGVYNAKYKSNCLDMCWQIKDSLRVVVELEATVGVTEESLV